jgi:hypothetical protein
MDSLYEYLLQPHILEAEAPNLRATEVHEESLKIRIPRKINSIAETSLCC